MAPDSLLLSNGPPPVLCPHWVLRSPRVLPPVAVSAQPSSGPAPASGAPQGAVRWRKILVASTARSQRPGGTAVVTEAFPHHLPGEEPSPLLGPQLSRRHSAGHPAVRADDVGATGPPAGTRHVGRPLVLVQLDASSEPGLTVRTGVAKGSSGRLALGCRLRRGVSVQLVKAKDALGTELLPAVAALMRRRRHVWPWLRGLLRWPCQHLYGETASRAGLCMVGNLRLTLGAADQRHGNLPQRRAVLPFGTLLVRRDRALPLAATHTLIRIQAGQQSGERRHEGEAIGRGAHGAARATPACPRE